MRRAIQSPSDYIYEYRNTEYGDGTALGRVPMPDKETIALSDYRIRHAQYKADADSQAVHRQHPFICVWDDHEFSNNAWRDGAQNHDASEGDWMARRNAAEQAYYEWMPIREDAQTAQSRIYRTFRFGDLVTLMMLDTRLVGRDQESARDDTKTIVLPERQLLGVEQEAWLAEQMVTSVRNGARWNLLGQQVVFAPQTESARGQHGFLGRLPRRPRPRVRHDRSREDDQRLRVDRRCAQLVGLRPAAESV